MHQAEFRPDFEFCAPAQALLWTRVCIVPPFGLSLTALRSTFIGIVANPCVPRASVWLDFDCFTPAQDYPAQPFFLRVVTPRCVWYTGHVTAGGSICIEALTLSGGPNGWTSALCVESVLNLVITNMCAVFPVVAWSVTLLASCCVQTVMACVQASCKRELAHAVVLVTQR